MDEVDRLFTWSTHSAWDRQQAHRNWLSYSSHTVAWHIFHWDLIRIIFDFDTFPRHPTARAGNLSVQLFLFDTYVTGFTLTTHNLTRSRNTLSGSISSTSDQSSSLSLLEFIASSISPTIMPSSRQDSPSTPSERSLPDQSHHHNQGNEHVNGTTINGDVQGLHHLPIRLIEGDTMYTTMSTRVRDQRLTEEVNQIPHGLNVREHREGIRNLQALLASDDANYRLRMLARAEHTPALRNSLWAYWDAADTALYLREQAEVFLQLYNQALRLQRLHSGHRDSYLLELYRAGAYDTILATSNGTGTPEDPIDLDHDDAPQGNVAARSNEPSPEAEDAAYYSYSDHSDTAADRERQLYEAQRAARRVRMEMQGGYDGNSDWDD